MGLPGALRVVNGHLGCWALFLAWIKLAFIMGNLRSTGIYFSMFVNVFTNVVKVTVFYLPISIGFGFGFFMLLPHNNEFSASLTSSTTVVVMMLGELQFADNFTWEDTMADAAVISAQVLFIAFVITVPIVMINIVVGVAINEVRTLQAKAELLSLKRTI